MIPRILYLHIGMGRCGSSAVQMFLRDNRAVLRQHGIALPSAVELGAVIGARHSGNATGLALALSNHKPGTPDALKNIARVVDHLKTVAEPNVLLSSEFLQQLPIKHFAALRDALTAAGFGVVVICYIRDQREWMISRYGQAVKSRAWTCTLEEYMTTKFRTHNLRYLGLFRPLRGLFGADNLKIRIFDRTRMPDGDVRKDFCSVVGVPTAGMAFSDGDLNASGNVLQVELMRIMNGAPKEYAFRFHNREFLKVTHDLFTSGGLSSPQDMYRMVQPKVMAKLGAYFRKHNERFRAEFFPSHEGPLFGERIPKHYEPLRADNDAFANLVLLQNEYINRLLKRRSKAEGRRAKAAPAVRRDAATAGNAG